LIKNKNRGSVVCYGDEKSKKKENVVEWVFLSFLLLKMAKKGSGWK